MELFVEWKIIEYWYLFVVFFAMAFAFFGFYFFRKYNNFGYWTIKIVALIFLIYRMFTLSVFYRTAKGYYGEENAWRFAFPFELSSLSYLILPIIILMDYKNKNITVLYFMAFFAGVVTMLAMLVSPKNFTEFGSQIMYESVFSHAVLFILPIWCIGTGKIKFHHKDWYRYIIGFIILSLYGVIINKIVFPNPQFEHNQIMFLKNNMLPLPMQITGIAFFDYLVYISIFLMAIFYSLRQFNKWNDKSLKKSKQKVYEKNLLDIIKTSINN